MRQAGVGEERRSCAVASLTLASDQICGLSHSGSTGCTQHDVRWCGQRRFKGRMRLLERFRSGRLDA